MRSIRRSRRRLRLAATLTSLTALAALAAEPGPAASPAAAPPPALIAVEVPAAPGATPEPCADGARLVKVRDGRVSPVVAGFAAACEPALDAGADHLYFAARRETGGPWAVWGLDLTGESAGARPRRLTPEAAGCREPAPLPGGALAVACGGDLYRVDPTGSGEVAPTRLTAAAGRLGAPAALPDGRLMVRLAASGGESLLLISQPDGTWATPWRDDELAALESFRPVAPDGLLLAFAGEGPLAAASLADPFAARRAVGPAEGWRFRDPAPLPDGSLVAAARPAAGGSPFALVRLAAAAGAAPAPLAAAAGAHLLQPVPLASRPEAPVLPSIVKPEMTSGYLVLFAAARTDDGALAGLEPGGVAAVRLFPWEEGVASPRAVDLAPEEDGSLFLEVPADRPLGVALVGSGGELLPVTGGPFWVRPNERRACLGCHVSNRYAPPDVRPKALTSPPRKVDWQSGAVSRADGQSTDQETP